MDRISSYLLLGFEGTDDLLIPFGLSGNAVSRVDTHDGHDDLSETEAIRKRDEEFRNQRNKLRADLLRAVERTTGRPPNLDLSLKQLASIAKNAPGFDYKGMLRDIEDSEARAYESALSSVGAIAERKRREEQAAEQARITLQRQQEEETMLMILAML